MLFHNSIIVGERIYPDHALFLLKKFTLNYLYFFTITYNVYVAEISPMGVPHKSGVGFPIRIAVRPHQASVGFVPCSLG